MSLNDWTERGENHICIFHSWTDDGKDFGERRDCLHRWKCGRWCEDLTSRSMGGLRQKCLLEENISKQKLKSKLSQENQRWNMFMLDQRGYCCRNILINIYLPAQVLMFHHRQLKWDTDIKKKNPNGIRDIKAGGVVGNRRVRGI